MSEATLQFRTSTSRPRRARGRAAQARAQALGVAPRRALGHREPTGIIEEQVLSVRPSQPLLLVAPNGQSFWAGSDRR